MFGGFGNIGDLSDTWVYDGTAGTWEQANPSLSPLAVWKLSMFTDPQNGRADVFGGYNSTTGRYQSSTWQFAGTTWIQLEPATSPAARSNAVSAFDPVTMNAVLFGGQGAFGANVDTTWTWVGVNWTEQSPAQEPPAIVAAAAAFAPDLGVVIVFGDTNQGNGTLAWTGNDWARLHPTNSPPARGYLGMASDLALGHVVIFGGRNIAYTYFNDTWELIPDPTGKAKQ
jgi:hypothetical protein